MTTADDFFVDPSPNELLDDLKQLIWNGYMHDIPRHLQKELGPSEIGDPCARKLAYKTLAPDEARPNFVDPLPSLSGTAKHTLWEQFAKSENERLGWKRWEPELTVSPREGFYGHCDLYDYLTDTVVDWKHLGKKTFQKLKDQGPTQMYRRQGHMYGLGYERAGFPVKRVAICALPEGGLLRNAHLWSEPYDRQLALDTIARYDQIIAVSDALDVEHHPERFHLIPATPSEESCAYCEYKSKEPGPFNCPGPALIEEEPKL